MFPYIQLALIRLAIFETSFGNNLILQNWNLYIFFSFLTIDLLLPLPIPSKNIRLFKNLLKVFKFHLI